MLRWVAAGVVVAASVAIEGVRAGLPLDTVSPKALRFWGMTFSPPRRRPFVTRKRAVDVAHANARGAVRELELAQCELREPHYVDRLCWVFVYEPQDGSAPRPETLRIGLVDAHTEEWLGIFVSLE